MTQPGANLRTMKLDYRQCNLLTATGSFDTGPDAFSRLTVGASVFVIVSLF